MNRREFVVSTFAAAVSLSQVARASGQAKTIKPDLSALADAHSLRLFNRGASPLADGARKGVRLSEAPGEGIALLPGIDFGNGSIEFDVRGKDVAQQSFVGARPVYRGPIAIDATWKTGYPLPLTMPEGIIQRVDQRWNEYFPRRVEGGR